MSELLPDQIETIRAKLIQTGAPLNPGSIAQVIRENVPITSPISLYSSVDDVIASTIGFGPLEKLLAKPGVTDVLVNSYSDVWFDQGDGLVRSDINWKSETELRDYAARLASSVNRRLDDVNPFVDARLKNGIRFHAVIPPISQIGTTMSFRIPNQKQFTVAQLVELGTFDSAVAVILKRIVQTKISFAISGNTGSGKTTILGTLLGEVDSSERMVVIEDSTELKIDHPHVVSLQARMANSEGIGQIELSALVKQTMRMRPDRIVVGEIRGTEVIDLLIGLNTGHQGGCLTLHANNTQAVIARFEALGLLAKVPKAAIHALLGQAIQVLLHVQRTKSGRKLTEISLLEYNSGNVQVLPALDLIEQKKIQPGWDKFQKLLGL